MTMTLVSTVTVGSGGAGSISFTGIPATATDLLITFSLRTDRSGLDPDVQNFYFNDNGASYTTKRLRGNGSGVTSSSPFYLNPLATSDDQTANTFSSGQIYVPNYAGSTNKTASVEMVTETNATEAWQVISAMTWANTSAITSVQIAGAGGNFRQYSTASLYTITKGSGGATVS